MSTELTPVEAASLAEHEAVIERGLNTFVEVGTALLAIRDGREYRATHAAFEDYCQQRWGMRRQRANELIAAARVVDEISSTDVPAPSNEAQAVALARIPEPERAEVWRETIERTGGKPTAAAIRETYTPPVPAVPPSADAEPFDSDDWDEEEEPDGVLPQPVGDATPRWGTPESRTADVVRCEAGHLAARTTFEDVDGCPYCLRTPGERQAAVQARQTLLRRQREDAAAQREAASHARLDAELDAELDGTDVRFRRNFAAAAVRAGELTTYDADRVGEVFAGNWDRDVGDLLGALTAWCSLVSDAHRRQQRAGLRIVGGDPHE